MGGASRRRRDAVRGLFGDRSASSLYDLSVYVQPNTNHLLINYSAQNNATVKIKIYDLSGKAILQENQMQEAGKNEYSLDLSGVTKGIYFVELLTTDSSTSRKVVL